MARYTKTDVVTGDVVKSDVNVQLGLIETAVADTLSRKGDLPNTMEADIDMNSNQILNLPDATTSQEPMTLSQGLATLNWVRTDSDAKYYDTVAAATSDTSLAVGDIVILKDRANGVFDVISETGTANTYNIIAHGTLSLSLELRVGPVANALQFGAAGDFSGAIDAMNSSGVKSWFIPKADYTQATTNTITLDELEVVNEGQITNDGRVVFLLNGPLKFKLTGGEYIATDYQTDRPVVVDSRNGSDCLDHHIEGCKTTNMSICDLGVKEGTSKTTVVHNKIESDDSTDTYVTNSGTAAISILPWANILIRGTVTDAREKSSGLFCNNTLDCFQQSGTNVDFMKISGDTKGFKVAYNDIFNRNTAADTEFDFFGGARGAKVAYNNFKNVSMKVQTHEDTGVTLAERVVISGNEWDFEAGCENEWGVLIKSSFVNFSNNIMRYIDPDRAAAKGSFTGVWINEMNNAGNGFGDTQPVAINYTGNIIDFSQAFSTNVVVKTTIVFNAFASTFTGNTWIGGEIISPSERCVFSGNQFYSTEVSDADILVTKHKMGESNNILSNTYTNLKGPFGSITGSITTGTPDLVVSDSSRMSKNQKIDIAGVTGPLTITAISGTAVTLGSNADATVSGAAVTNSESFDRSPKHLTYRGNPENNVTADVGDICTSSTGGASTTLYIKESGTGSTGWVAK